MPKVPLPQDARAATLARDPLDQRRVRERTPRAVWTRLRLTLVGRESVDKRDARRCRAQLTETVRPVLLHRPE